MRMETKGLHPYVKKLLDQFILEAKKHGYTLGVSCGSRTFAQQTIEYAKGRTTGIKGRIVTNAKAGESFHNYDPSLAFDIIVSLDGGKTVTWDSKHYIAVSKFKPKELTFGGDWDNDGNIEEHKFKDYPHYQFDNNGKITIEMLQKGYKLPLNYGISVISKVISKIKPSPSKPTPTISTSSGKIMPIRND